MTQQQKHPIRRRVVQLLLLLAVVAVGGFVSKGYWLPQLREAIAARGDIHSHDDHSHDGHAHGADECGDDGHSHGAKSGHSHADGEQCDEDSVIDLTPRQQKNIGLRQMKVTRRDFDRTVTVPAIIIERPGRSRVNVSAPMTGIVTRIYPIAGEAVTPGQPLFDIRLTHEDLVSSQSKYLQTVEELDVTRREVARLDKVTASGAIAGKALLTRQYEQQKTEAALHAQRQALILHGLTDKQVDDIASQRKLLQQLTVYAPEPPKPTDGPNGTSETDGTDESKEADKDQLLQVAEINVAQGQHVEAGESLCLLTDHSALYIEGKAFEEDAPMLHKAETEGTDISALVGGNGHARVIPYLKILRVEGEIQRDSRTLRFYTRLPNELIRNEKLPDGHRFIAWRYKPGQRVELRLPVERWKERMVVPTKAVVEDGVDRFVFVKKGNHFHRTPVHVEHKDRLWAVLGDDGTLSPGDSVVAAGAYQMHLDMKNAARGDDPHAGHSH